MKITAKATASGQRMSLEEIRDFAASVPDEAAVEPIWRDVGTQRDPEVVLHGLSASWEASA